ncbi:MAG: GntR family transcriptional regulator [Lachnospiraceae bacterium]
MAWEFNVQSPIYQQIAEIMRRRILNGVYPQGSRLPAVRDLALEAGVNPNTMQRALQALEDSGIVCSRRTLGRFVTEDEHLLEALKFIEARQQVRTFVSRMAQMGYSVDDLDGLIRKVMADEPAASYEVSEGTGTFAVPGGADSSAWAGSEGRRAGDGTDYYKGEDY